MKHGRLILSIITVLLMGVVVYFAREDIAEAWQMATSAKIGFILLLIPVQALMFFSGGQIYFSYLKTKESMRKVNFKRRMRLALELNFVKNIIPAGGITGVAYLAWRLKRWGITAGETTLAQVVRYCTVSVASVVFVMGSSFWLLAHGVGWAPVLIGLGLSGGTLLILAFLIWLLRERKRINLFGKLISQIVNLAVRLVTFGRRKRLISASKIDEFLGDMHRDVTKVLAKKKALLAPSRWSLVYVLCDAGTFFLVILALGAEVSFPAVLIAQTLASVVGTLAQTPGNGAGFYEATMTAYFALVGVPFVAALAAALMTRVIVLLSTIIFGWPFYQHALTTGGDGKKDGKGIKLSPQEL